MTSSTPLYVQLTYDIVEARTASLEGRTVPRWSNITNKAEAITYSYLEYRPIKQTSIIWKKDMMSSLQKFTSYLSIWNKPRHLEFTNPSCVCTRSHHLQVVRWREHAKDSFTLRFCKYPPTHWHDNTMPLLKKQMMSFLLSPHHSKFTPASRVYKSIVRKYLPNTSAWSKGMTSSL